MADIDSSDKNKTPSVQPFGTQVSSTGIDSSANPVVQTSGKSQPFDSSKKKDGESNVVTPTKPKRSFKKLFTVLGIVLLLLVIVGVVVRFVLPNIGKVTKEESAITWWGLWEDEAIVQPLIAEYEQANSGVKIDYVRQSKEDYRERLTNALAKGQGPDIFRFHNTWVSMFENELDMMPSSVMSGSEYTQSFYPVALNDLGSTSGGFAGIPLEYDGIALFINEDIFANAAKSAPTTWDDLRETAKELTIIDDQGVITQSGAALGRTENVDHWPEILALMMVQNGANLANPTNKNAFDALSFFTVFSNTDGVWDETLPPSTTAFASGKVAMYFGPSWRAFDIKQTNPGLKFRMVGVPQLPKDSPSEPDIAYATYWAEGVWARSGNKAEAWKFLKFMSTKESLEKLYTNAAQTRLFGEPYPRVDMRELLLKDPYLGGLISQAADARSWYLVDRTFDGPTGINSQINSYYEDAVNAVNNGEDPEDVLLIVAKGVTQVLAQYGINTTK